MNLFKQRGALFGLDARIALAIVGSLSVVSGVSLLQSSVSSRAAVLEQQSENISTILSNTQESWGNSILFFIEATAKDQAAEIPINIARALMDDSILDPRPNNWVGPYISKVKLNASDEVESVNFGILRIHRMASGNGAAANPIDDGCTGRNCYYWIHFDNTPESLSKRLDETIDDSNPLTGAVRYLNTNFYYRGPRSL